MANKLAVAVVFGGRSPEHQVSCRSAALVAASLDPDRYQLIRIWIDPEGVWRLLEPHRDWSPDDAAWRRPGANTPVLLVPGGKGALMYSDWTCAHREVPRHVDVVFPVVHGPGGEDGSLQGCLEQARVAYVGSNVASSALCLDKSWCRQLLRDAGLPVLPFIRLQAGQMLAYAQALQQLGRSSLMVKPVAQGSSFGVAKVADAAGYQRALDAAFGYGDAVMIEPALERPRELEVGLLEMKSGQLKASAVGEIKVSERYDFYTYTAKYDDPLSVTVQLPASLDPELAQRLQGLAVQAGKAAGCAGLARVDFFMDAADGNRIYINEINTMPGMTESSLYPRLWRQQGYSDPQWVDMLLAQALRRHIEAASYGDRAAPGSSTVMPQSSQVHALAL